MSSPWLQGSNVYITLTPGPRGQAGPCGEWAGPKVTAPEEFSPPTPREGLENKGSAPFLAESPLQSSSGLPRLLWWRETAADAHRSLVTAGF